MTYSTDSMINDERNFKKPIDGFCSNDENQAGKTKNADQCVKECKTNNLCVQATFYNETDDQQCCLWQKSQWQKINSDTELWYNQLHDKVMSPKYGVQTDVTEVSGLKFWPSKS